MTPVRAIRAVALALGAVAMAFGARAPRGTRTDAPRRIRASARLAGWDRRRGLQEARLRAEASLRMLGRPGSRDLPYQPST